MWLLSAGHLPWLEGALALSKVEDVLGSAFGSLELEDEPRNVKQLGEAYSNLPQ